MTSSKLGIQKIKGKIKTILLLLRIAYMDTENEAGLDKIESLIKKYFG
jgi:hypothetical protein